MVLDMCASGGRCHTVGEAFAGSLCIFAFIGIYFERHATQDLFFVVLVFRLCDPSLQSVVLPTNTNRRQLHIVYSATRRVCEMLTEEDPNQAAAPPNHALTLADESLTLL